MERFGLTLLVLACFALLVWAMWRGWRRQALDQSLAYDPFPEIPADLPDAELGAASGIYVATTKAGRWQERIVTRGVGMRGPATLRRYEAGVVVERHGAKSFFIPAESITAVNTGKAVAGKVMGTDALLVITWQLGEAHVDTGFRGDDISVYGPWIESLAKHSSSKGDDQ